MIPPRLEDAALPDGRRIVVVRDDELPGGTKRRVLPGLLAAWPEEEFVYAGPAYGYAQVALAYSAGDVGRRATVVLPARREPHPLTREALSAGARIIEVPAGRLSVLQARARGYAELVGARLLPLGFDIPEFVDALAAVARALPVDPAEVWAIAGSGALTRALQAAWPRAAHHAIRIGHAPDAGEARLWRAPEAFEEPAREPPPFPSCANYDAKAWRIMAAEAAAGALFWNVAS